MINQEHADVLIDQNAPDTPTYRCLLFLNRPTYDEYSWLGIYANLHQDTILLLKKQKKVEGCIVQLLVIS